MIYKQFFTLRAFYRKYSRAFLILIDAVNRSRYLLLSRFSSKDRYSLFGKRFFKKKGRIFKYWLALTLIITSTAVCGQNRSRPLGLDEGMERMAEILGSLHYLDNLCHNSSEEWRLFMDRLILTENNMSPDHRTRLVMAFNRSYRAFSENYLQCTKAAVQATDLYRREGRILADELVKRYGN